MSVGARHIAENAEAHHGVAVSKFMTVNADGYSRNRVRGCRTPKVHFPIVREMKKSGTAEDISRI